MVSAAIGFIVTPLFRNDRRIGAAGIAAAVPIFTVSLYVTVGAPQAAGLEPSEPAPHRLAGSSPLPGKKAASSVASLVDGLAERLESNPDDGKSWLLLARSYKHLARMHDASEAYRHAQKLGEYDEELAVMASHRSDPTLPIVEVSGRVALSPEAAALARPTDTVFVFARAVGGPAMPVAVLQRPVAALPFNFHLGDKHSISNAAKISDYERVVVTARITRAGNAKDALRGLEARSEEVVVSDDKPVDLTIDHQEKQ